MNALRLAVVVAAAAIAGPVATAQAEKDDLSLVSRATGAFGAAVDFNAFDPSISGDGRFVAFSSEADNLSSEDNDAFRNVFVRDLRTQTTVLVSRAKGVAGDGTSREASISADGRFVAFASEADNLSGEDADGTLDIFVRDLQAQTTDLVSRSPMGGGADGDSDSPAVSADGRFVAFNSQAENLSAEDEDGTLDVFVRDRQTGTTLYASRASGAAGAQGNGPSVFPSISSDGRYVAFQSLASSLSGDDIDGLYDVFVRDLVTNTTVLASRAGNGAAADGDSWQPSISADGRSVAFTSEANNLTAGDDDDYWNIFVRDLQHGAVTYVSGAGGAAGDLGSMTPSISADGRFVAFVSYARNLSAEDDNAFADVFVHDLHANATTFVSRGAGATGAPGNDHSSAPAISGDGRFVAFSSQANNLSAEDDDARWNVFRRDVLGDPSVPPAPLTLAPGITAGDTTGPRLLASSLMRANRSIRVSRRGRFTLFCGRYAEPVTGTCRVRRLAARPFVAAPGKRALARFRLPRPAFRALTTARRLTMRATVVARDRSGNATTARFRVVLKAPKEER